LRDKSRYADYTGCGNTLNANQSIVRRLIQDSLRYWVSRMHVDGFRFDLASILSRDEEGRLLPNPPVLWDIESDPLHRSERAAGREANLIFVLPPNVYVGPPVGGELLVSNFARGSETAEIPQFPPGSGGGRIRLRTESEIGCSRRCRGVRINAHSVR
jgi:hypothetical protein